MTYLMQGVVERGTAMAASFLLNDAPLAGKTGTTDKYTDAWFIGFSPSLCAGVWIGYDDNRTLGSNEAGAVAALPVWIEFFKSLIDDEKKMAVDKRREVLRRRVRGPARISSSARSTGRPGSWPRRSASGGSWRPSSKEPSRRDSAPMRTTC